MRSFFIAAASVFVIPAALRAQSIAGNPPEHLFVVAEPAGFVHNGDSYVLRLSNPDDIAHARDLIDRGIAAGMSIALARIAPGADGQNVDYLAPGQPAWSWHITEFIGFADVTPEILDGWPGFVEMDVDGWINNTDGTIGFWTYTVLAEIPPPCPADLTGDGLIDLGDLGILLANFGTGDGGDTDGDSDTDLADLGTVLAAFGTTCD